GPPELPPSGAMAPADVATLPKLKAPHPSPDYPAWARRTRTEGKVVLRALVLRTGEAVVTGVYSATSPEFIGAAAESVGRWRYEPALRAGEPVAVDYTVRVNFRTRSSSPAPRELGDR